MLYNSVSTQSVFFLKFFSSNFSTFLTSLRYSLRDAFYSPNEIVAILFPFQRNIIPAATKGNEISERNRRNNQGGRKIKRSGHDLSGENNILRFSCYWSRKEWKKEKKTKKKKIYSGPVIGMELVDKISDAPLCQVPVETSSSVYVYGGQRFLI